MSTSSLTESDVHSAYLDADGSLHLYDRAGNNLEGWPQGWPEKIGCVSTFLKERCIWMVNKTYQISLPEQVAAQFTPECGLPPPGWKCARKAGHEGPCAAVPTRPCGTVPIMLSDEPWIGVDLDATLAHYDDWRGIDHIGPPIEAMQTRVLQWLSEGKHVRILTARVGPQRHDVPHTIEEITHHIEQWCLQHLGQVLPVTCQKDYNMESFYDDRCIQVIPNTGKTLPDELRAQENASRVYRAVVTAALDAAHAPTHHPATNAPLRKPMMPDERIQALGDAIAELNQRLIDRTTGFMQTLGQQALEIAQWKSACQTEQTNAQIWAKEVGEAIRQVEASDQLNRQLLAALQQAYVHNQNMHCFVTKGRLNDQLNEQTHVLRKALGIPGAQPPSEKTSVSFLSDDSAGDWPEDFAHENGNYSMPCRKCGKTFLGYKRRTICKKCVAIKETLVSHAGLDAKEAAAIQSGVNSLPEEDPYQSEDYQRFVAKVAETCAAEDGPCDACLAGGICDGPSETPDYFIPSDGPDDDEG